MLPDVRGRLGRSLFHRVAGPEGPARRARIHGTPGPRWFGPERPIRTVHADAAMFTGGLAALLLQSLHPLAMAAVAAHSGYRGDPWGRLQRTSTFLAVTTYGTAGDAQRAVDRVRGIHARISGTTADGEAYRAADPHLLAWVHLCETDCFLRAHERYGAHRLDADGYDAYVADTARVAEALGVADPPRDRRALAERLGAYRPELRATPEARATARFLLLRPPVPPPALPFYAVLAANAVSLLPPWARGLLWLPRVPLVEDIAVRPAGHALTWAIRWAMNPPPSSPADRTDDPAGPARQGAVKARGSGV
ncbi:oxygenase MpaB family protein [Streptomyces anandii]|uniref:oxygenase MpaB family protein n=1 Tax=Streptomyces anandii TaxID=285454 RepID=UPI0037AD2F00